MKEWLIKKLGGYTQKEKDAYIGKSLKTLNQVQDELNTSESTNRVLENRSKKLLFEFVLLQNGVDVNQLRNQPIHLQMPINYNNPEFDPNRRVDNFSLSEHDDITTMIKTFAKMRYNFNLKEYGYRMIYNGMNIINLDQLRDEMKKTQEYRV